MVDLAVLCAIINMPDFSSVKKQLKRALKLTTPRVEGNYDSSIPNGDIR